MKKNYLIIVLFAITIQTSAQHLEENFENAISALDPDLGWIQTEPESSGLGWFYDTVAGFVVSGNRSAIVYGDVNNWLISPGFNLTAGEEVTINFNYRTNFYSPSETADIAVFVGTINSSEIAQQGTVIMENNDINSPEISNFSATFIPSFDGIYHLAFHVKTDTNESFSVDDVSVRSGTLSNEIFEEEQLNIYSNFTEKEIIIKNSDVKKLDLYSILGQKKLSLLKPKKINVKDFNKGIYIIRAELDNGNVVSKKIVLN